MIQSQALSRWTRQSSYTRVVTSVSFAAAFMVLFYYAVSHGPTLVDAHSLLMSFFETDKGAREAISYFVIWFSLGVQVVLALACAYVGKRLSKERVAHRGIVLLWLFYGLVLFLVSLAIGLANYSGREVTTLWLPNAALFAQMSMDAVIFLVLYFMPLLCSSKTPGWNNPMFALAMSKLLLLPCLILIVSSKAMLTLVIGSYLLDFLLYPVGEKIRETTV